MKIGFFTENYYKGGLDTFLINLFNAWPEAIDELNLVCNASHPGLETIASKTKRPLKIEKYSRLFTSKVAIGQSALPLGRIYPVRVFFVLAYRILQYPVLFPWYLLSLTLFFRRRPYDRLIVVNGGYPASLLCRCALIAWRFSGRRPLAVLNFHNSTTQAPWYFKCPEYLIDLAVIWSTKQIVSVSRDCLKSLDERLAFSNYTKRSYIYNGIADPTLKSVVGKQDTQKDTHADRYCLMLATYEPRKGHAYLLQAFKRVVAEFPNVHLRIYGYGTTEEKETVFDEVKRLELAKNVSLHDFAPDIGALIAKASMLVVPSQAYESFGLTIIEAMAYGTPVVTTDVGGMPEVLGDTQAGYVCAKDDPLAFADAMKRILADPPLAAELGNNGRQAFEQRFRAEIMAHKYALLLKENT